MVCVSLEQVRFLSIALVHRDIVRPSFGVQHLHSLLARVACALEQYSRRRVVDLSWAFFPCWAACRVCLLKGLGRSCGLEKKVALCGRPRLILGCLFKGLYINDTTPRAMIATQ